MSQITIDGTVLDKTLVALQLSGRMAKIAQRLDNEKQATTAAVESCVGDIVDAMIKSGAADESQKSLVRDMLHSHAETLSLLKQAVEKTAFYKAELDKVKKLDSLGKPVDRFGKEAGVSPQQQYGHDKPYDGGHTSAVRDSDRALFGLRR